MVLWTMWFQSHPKSLDPSVFFWLMGGIWEMYISGNCTESCPLSVLEAAWEPVTFSLSQKVDIYSLITNVGPLLNDSPPPLVPSPLNLIYSQCLHTWGWKRRGTTSLRLGSLGGPWQQLQSNFIYIFFFPRGSVTGGLWTERVLFRSCSYPLWG